MRVEKVEMFNVGFKQVNHQKGVYFDGLDWIMMNPHFLLMQIRIIMPLPMCLCVYSCWFSPDCEWVYIYV